MLTFEEYVEGVAEAARAVDRAEFERLLVALEQAYAEGRTVYIIGNGGSAANASHFAQDLSKGALPDMEGKRFRILSLTDNVAFLTAVANDMGYDRVFDVQVRQLASEGDILIAISGSGKSPNILKAVERARAMGLRIVGFTGFDGGPLRDMADIKIHVPLNQMCMTEAVHAMLMHMTVDFLRERLAG